jgi:hypothetical protein
LGIEFGSCFDLILIVEETNIAALDSGNVFVSAPMVTRAVVNLKVWNKRSPDDVNEIMNHHEYVSIRTQGATKRIVDVPCFSPLLNEKTDYTNPLIAQGVAAEKLRVANGKLPRENYIALNACSRPWKHHGVNCLPTNTVRGRRSVRVSRLRATVVSSPGLTIRLKCLQKFSGRVFTQFQDGNPGCEYQSRAKTGIQKSFF